MRHLTLPIFLAFLPLAGCPTGDSASPTSSTAAANNASSSASSSASGSMGGSSSSSGATSSSSSSSVSGGLHDAGYPDVFGPEGAESTDPLCSNGIDDDNNGFPDCQDFWCRDSVAVTVCGSLENTATSCSDAIDRGESPGNPNTVRNDGLVDCDDPDCRKNPTLPAGICPPLRFELALECEDTIDNDEDGLADCLDPDCLHASVSTCTPRERVLFDDRHRERAGSADWVIDVPGVHPFPSVPGVESHWAGNLSAFGKGLLDTGRFTVETAPSWSRDLTHGDATNPQDLQHYDVLVLPEPSAPLTDAESDAVLAFIQAGGGVLMVTDHFDSDRDGNNWDSVQVFNAMLTRMGNGVLDDNPLGFSVTEISYDESGNIQQQNGEVASTVASGQDAHPVMSGAHGTVDRVGMHRAGLFTVDPSGPAVVLMHGLPLGTSGYEMGSPYVVASQLGTGRVVAIGDSAIMSDGTDSHGIVTSGFDAWHALGEDNGTLFLNAVEWLAE